MAKNQLMMVCLVLVDACKVNDSYWKVNQRLPVATRVVSVIESIPEQSQKKNSSQRVKDLFSREFDLTW